MEDSGGLQSMGLQRVRHDWGTDTWWGQKGRRRNALGASRGKGGNNKWTYLYSGSQTQHENQLRISLAVEWLRCSASKAGRSLVRELRFHLPRGTVKNLKKKKSAGKRDENTRSQTLHREVRIRRIGMGSRNPWFNISQMILMPSAHPVAFWETLT